MDKPERVRLLIVDDHPVVLEGLRTMFYGQPKIEVVAVCASGEEALACLQHNHADVLLADLRMRPMNGIEFLQSAFKVVPGAKGVILSSYEFEEDVFQAVQAGASAFLSKDLSATELFAAIDAVIAGNEVLPAHLRALVEHRRQQKQLSRREHEILQLLAKGLTNKEIANAFGVSQFTVRNQIASITAKLEAADRTEAVHTAIEQGILKLL